MGDAEKIVRFPDVGAVEAEAAEWVVRLESGDATAEDYAKFQEWQSRSPLHREAAQRLAALWSDLDVLKNYAAPGEGRQPLWHAAREWPWRSAAAAAAVLLVIGTAAWLQLPMRSIAPTVLHYATAVGAQKTVTLPDDTTVLLNTDSRLEVVFSEHQREVRLKRGEAYFEVAHKDKRPFTVYCDERRVRDIGTAFDIHRLPKAVEVTVTRGAVELAVAPRPADERHLAVLIAGQKAVFDRKIEYVKPVSDTDINRQLAWRQGVLVYAGEPLAKVIADASRYTSVKIEIGDPRLASVPVGGYFEISRIGALFDALRSNFGIEAEWLDASHVRLTAAKGERANRPPPPREE